MWPNKLEFHTSYVQLEKVNLSYGPMKPQSGTKNVYGTSVFLKACYECVKIINLHG